MKYNEHPAEGELTRHGIAKILEGDANPDSGVLATVEEGQLAISTRKVSHWQREESIRTLHNLKSKSTHPRGVTTKLNREARVGYIDGFGVLGEAGDLQSLDQDLLLP